MDGCPLAPAEMRTQRLLSVNVTYTGTVRSPKHILLTRNRHAREPCRRPPLYFSHSSTWSELFFGAAHQSSLSDSSSKGGLVCVVDYEVRRETLTTPANLLLPLLQSCSQRASHTTIASTGSRSATSGRTTTTCRVANLGTTSITDLTPIDLLEGANTTGFLDVSQHG